MRSLRPLATAQQEFRQIYPAPGLVEHDPEEIWSSVVATATDALTQSGLTTSDIAAIGITNQRETTLIWDRATGKPIHNAIVWQDRRTEDICAALRRSGQEADDRREDRARARSVFLRHQDRLAARSRRGCARGGGGGATRLRHHRHLSDLAAHRRARACHRRDQCRAHAAVRYPQRAVGPGACRDLPRAARAAAAT